ncbi:MAG: hypothetical protein ACK40S_10710 [Burkholderiaceae bacterium]
MKSVLSILALAGVAVLAGCASSPSVPVGMQAGKFVSYECEGGKRFQARLAVDGNSVRIRYEGGYELDRIANGVYEGEGWRLQTQGKVELQHHGKTMLRDCRAM